MAWTIVENIIGECMPKCVQKLLTACGYSTLLSLKSISAESIVQINEHVNVHCRDLIQNLTCTYPECSCECYKNQFKFQLLPGHREFILAIAKAIDQPDKCEHENHDENEYELLMKAVEKNSTFSVIMKELMKTALQNGQYTENHAQYSDSIRYFATYIFIVGGRACYTALCKNLPLPSISSIREYQFCPSVCFVS